MDHLDCEDIQPEETSWTCFDFRGFEPNDSVKFACKTALDDLSKLLTDDCTLVSRLEHDGIEFCCSFDLFQRRGSMYSIDVCTDPKEAVKNAAEKLRNELQNQASAPSEPFLFSGNASSRENQAHH